MSKCYQFLLLSLAGAWVSVAWKPILPSIHKHGVSISAVRLNAIEARSSSLDSRRSVLGLLTGLVLAPQLLNPIPSHAAEEEQAAAPEAAAASPPPKTAYDFPVPFNGEYVDLHKFKGKATVVMNTKSDDPEALNQLPGLVYLSKKFGANNLKIWVFPTEQGTFETDDDDIIRIKYYQEYGFGQNPNAVVFDKINVVGKGADPLYKYLCLSLRNPNKVARITLNFEKFLLDENGRPLRRYPRKYSPFDMEPDIQAALAGEPLPPPSPAFIKAWRDAYQEAERSEYAFKKGLNYYDPNGTDMRPKPRSG